MTYLKNNYLTIILFIVLIAYIWRNNTLKYQRDNIEYKTQKEFIISHLKEIEKELKGIQEKSKIDSLERNKILENYAKPFQSNLTLNQLKHIRDSIRNSTRHALPNE